MPVLDEKPSQADRDAAALIAETFDPVQRAPGVRLVEAPVAAAAPVAQPPDRQPAATGTGLTPGRQVHYVLPDGPNAGEHRPATVVRVWGPDCVNLQVFTDGPNDGAQYAAGHVWATSVRYAAPEEQRPRTWHWIERA